MLSPACRTTQEPVMTIATYETLRPAAEDLPSEYQPGVCNIGQAEIARRRRAGHTGLIAAIGLFAALVLIGAPDWTRLLVGVPAIISASGYLQAHLRFCAGFGSAGVFNFGELGPTERVQSAADRSRDRARATQIGVASFAIGITVALIAYALPV
jgi:hypothetical protein